MNERVVPYRNNISVYAWPSTSVRKWLRFLDGAVRSSRGNQHSVIASLRAMLSASDASQRHHQITLALRSSVALKCAFEMQYYERGP